MPENQVFGRAEGGAEALAAGKCCLCGLAEGLSCLSGHLYRCDGHYGAEGNAEKTDGTDRGPSKRFRGG